NNTLLKCYILISIVICIVLITFMIINAKKTCFFYMFGQFLLRLVRAMKHLKLNIILRSDFIEPCLG
ncbi:hypothetical protein CU276_05195, partial [Yersinia kristensenii]